MSQPCEPVDIHYAHACTIAWCYTSSRSSSGQKVSASGYKTYAYTNFEYRIFISYIVDLGTHSINNSASWRIPVGLQMVWGLILLSGIFFLPESPYVLPLMHSREYALTFYRCE